MQRRVLLSCLFLSACSGGLDDSEDIEASAQVVGTTQPVTYYKDIKPIIDAKCTQCHADGQGGHFSLTTYRDVKPLAAAIKSVVSSGAMPPWKADGPIGQYVGDRRLTEQEKSYIVGWADQGAPEGRISDAPPASSTPRPTSGLPRVDLSLPIEEPYTPPPGRDDHRCFVLDWTPTTLKYITGLGIVPGDKQLVHHAIVYLVEPEGVADVWRRDEADTSNLGYRCMGGPSNSAWLTSYEPGGVPQMNPGGVGFAVKPGSALVLQVHYNTLHKHGPDQTRVEITTADRVDKVGEVNLIMNPTWPARTMRIPAHEPDVVHRWEGRPSRLTRGTSYDLYWADLHMHTIGSSGSIGILRSGGARETLLNIPKWDFDWQMTYNFVRPVRLGPNDNLWVECHFNNTEANQPVIDGAVQPVRDLNWGEGTSDEMCLGNVLAAVATGSTPTAPPVVTPPTTPRPPTTPTTPRPPTTPTTPRPPTTPTTPRPPTTPTTPRPPTNNPSRPDANCTTSSPSSSVSRTVSVGNRPTTTTVTRCTR